MSQPPRQRRRPRMRVILPQPHMFFHFTKPHNSDNLVDDDVDTSEESDACSKPNPDQTQDKDSVSQFKLEVHSSNNSSSLETKKRKSYFDCNLCSESERQPVVTACGHLFCHSCLCEWLEFSRKCPACGAEVVDGRVFPIYQCTGPRLKNH